LTTYPLAQEKVYRNDNGTGDVTTKYSYSWFSANSVQIEERVTTLPVIPTGQNGAGGSTGNTLTERYDTEGN
jgi:hypothetical protein